MRINPRKKRWFRTIFLPLSTKPSLREQRAANSMSRYCFWGTLKSVKKEAAQTFPGMRMKFVISDKLN